MAEKSLIKDAEIVALQARLDTRHDSAEARINAENMIWILGTRRTGSTWLCLMMADIDKHIVWHEPFVGEIFGSAYYARAWDWQRRRPDFALGDPHRNGWLRSIRNFILDGANIRFPEMSGEDYLVIKEPNGSMGAPLLMEAFPESRMIFLIRDPRDIVASDLDAHRKGSWMPMLIYESESDDETIADKDPDSFVRERAHLCLSNLQRTKLAYGNHKGPKVLIKYEDLRRDTLEELKNMYSGLDIFVDEKHLRRIVEKHSWENISPDQKGSGKPRRKASPGGWREDLTPKQAAVVEEITAPTLKQFYS